MKIVTCAWPGAIVFQQPAYRRGILQDNLEIPGVASSLLAAAPGFNTAGVPAGNVIATGISHRCNGPSPDQNTRALLRQ
jgi:hypothetical protein